MIDITCACTDSDYYTECQHENVCGICPFKGKACECPNYDCELCCPGAVVNRVADRLLGRSPFWADAGVDFAGLEIRVFAQAEFALEGKIYPKKEE